MLGKHVKVKRGKQEGGLLDFSVFSLLRCERSMLLLFFLVVVAESGNGIQPQ